MKNLSTICSCGHEKDAHYGELGYGGCDVNCDCDGYWPPSAQAAAEAMLRKRAEETDENNIN